MRRALLAFALLLAACESDQAKLDRLQKDERAASLSVLVYEQKAKAIEDEYVGRYSEEWRKRRAGAPDTLSSYGYMENPAWRSAMDSMGVAKDRLLFIQRDISRLLR